MLRTQCKIFCVNVVSATGITCHYQTCWHCWDQSSRLFSWLASSAVCLVRRSYLSTSCDSMDSSAALACNPDRKQKHLILLGTTMTHKPLPATKAVLLQVFFCDPPWLPEYPVEHTHVLVPILPSHPQPQTSHQLPQLPSSHLCESAPWCGQTPCWPEIPLCLDGLQDAPGSSLSVHSDLCSGNAVSATSNNHSLVARQLLPGGIRPRGIWTHRIGTKGSHSHPWPSCTLSPGVRPTAHSCCLSRNTVVHHDDSRADSHQLSPGKRHTVNTALGKHCTDNINRNVTLGKKFHKNWLIHNGSEYCTTTKFSEVLISAILAIWNNLLNLIPTNLRHFEVPKGLPHLHCNGS